ncbi:hypothetical protein FB451DRAFT_1020090 [Mycena latifolia]|nr:hypothetical protein FB451DRAFT_1020090 [Mycena latifolia]
MKTTASLALFVALATNVAAICPGFNFGIGNQINLGGGTSRCKLNARPVRTWNVYDDSCNQVDGLTTNQNPCDEGIFGCSPPPIIFDEYTSTFTGLRWPKYQGHGCSGVCGNDVISVCVSIPFKDLRNHRLTSISLQCRNDGN